MPDDAVIEVLIDVEIRDRASVVLAQLGLTIDDAVRLLLTRTAVEGALPAELEGESPEYGDWLRARVQEALDDPRPDIDGEEVERIVAAKRAELGAKIAKAS